MITQIPQNHCRIIERFGKPVRIQYSGLAYKLPFIENVHNVGNQWGGEANKQGVFIELTEQIKDTHPRECITRDNAKVLVNCVISWRVVDPIKAVYEVDDLQQSLTQAILNAVRSEIGAMDLDEALSARATLNERIVSTLSETASKWGIQVLRAEIQELKTDDATSAAMLQQLEADRRRRATISEAEGKARAEVLVAEAEKAAAILKAEGQARALELATKAEASYLQTLAQTIGHQEASRLLIANKYLSGFDSISQNPADKVFLPNSFQGLFSVSTESTPRKS